ncbi:MAG: helix-turn-helix domain-containing protein [Lachnospiraceae bacterium]|nr:helix-turn-helix domain-containing protein [Lachnospiraceae bacterium]
MSSLFEDLRDGLQEAIDYEKGVGSAKTTTYMISPVKKYTNEEIKQIRNKAGMTQSVFASYLGVSKKTVEAWELGRTHPTGPAYRLIDMLSSGQEKNLSFITCK